MLFSNGWGQYLVFLVVSNCYSATKGSNGRQQDETGTSLYSKLIEVHINEPENNGHFEVGSSFRLQCRFRRNGLVRPNLRFNLKWLRLLVGQSSDNQTITETDIDSSLSSSTIIAATTRIWSVRRDDGLDLELNYFQASDSGTYYCQAISVEPNPIILNETSVQIAAITSTTTTTTNTYADSINSGDILSRLASEQVASENDSSFDSFQLYSQENLSKLLPSLKIIPSSFNQIPIGETIQLACITNDLDPDPEPDKLEWTFEQISDRLNLLERQPVATRQLPYNVTVLGNILIIGSMLEEHSGLYKCTYQMSEFNLTTQASAEVHAIRGEPLYSAPLVFVKPELVRLSINGSATIQCETTGYPPPELIWYRVNDFAKSELIVNNTEQQAKILDSHIEGLVVERTDYKDLAAHCRLNRCFVQGQQDSSSSVISRLKLTGLSMIHLHDAKASHHGQYVCQASNQHGSNQATCIVDVEIKEAPSVSIAAQDREQTIVLPSDSVAHSGGESSSGQQNVTFKCSVTAGRPRARLRWLRTGNGPTKTNLEVDNLDLYDLTKVSSATSNVKTIAEDNGSTLTLTISTISLDDEGNYVCLGENEVGRQSAVARLTVRKPASIRILQSSPHVAKLNDSFHLDCLVSGHPIPIDIEWSRTDKGSFFSLISRSLHSSSQERAVLKFDRVTQEELGEYTCNARDPLNPISTLRDTIMVVLGDGFGAGATGEHQDSIKGMGVIARHNENTSLMPKLMVRPTKINAPVGSNVTLDCLAVSGLQPTLVEWLAPTNQQQQSHHQTNIRPYYRGGDISNDGQLLQFGSKLRILNVSKAHEGIYQCKGKNRIGIEIAPALIKVIDPQQDEWDPLATAGGKSPHLDQTAYSVPASSRTMFAGQQATRTKVAKHGSNIELKCQMNGIEQPATSWSRDKLELPRSSVQIGHNLWIQNVTNKDDGLYVCSARSREPNRIIQAKINLLVEGDSQRRLVKNLEAKIVASKSQVNKGDSITLECIISSSSGGANDSTPETTMLPNRGISADDLDEVERNVVWTNLHSGQTLFQDNVYILGNLLIIYELKFENSATYRCNYNDLAQYTDYKLQVLPDPLSSQTAEEPSSNPPLDSSAAQTLDQQTFTGQHGSTQILTARGQRAELKQVPLGSRLQLECSQQGETGMNYFWARGLQRIPLAADNRPLVIDSARPRDAGIYSCHQHNSNRQYHYLVNVLMPTARFTQTPVSFITLPTISGANQQQLEIELKFLPEHENGLLLFNGQQQSSVLNISSRLSSPDGDYLALGMVDGGHLEFKFELGDGMTSLKSFQPLSLNRWHRVMIERNRRGAVMWIDDQPAVSNSSTGKFFNLNLDSVLFVGGHQQFLYRSAGGPFSQQLYGYSKGFQGCISLLRIARQEVNLMARNRSVAVGIFECHKSECSDNFCSPHQNQQLSPATRVGLSASKTSMKQLNGVCQVDRDDFDQKWDPTSGQVSAQAGLRCVCMPGLGGDRCGELANSTTAVNRFNTSAVPETQQQSSKHQPGRACALLNPCSNLGTHQCQSLTSQSFKCHCKVGFTGTDCSKPVVYDDKHSVQFNRQSYLQLTFNKADIVESYLRNQSSVNIQSNNSSSSSSLFLDQNEFNATNYVKQISMGDHQNISFNLQTNSSYGLLFYTGQITFNVDSNSTNEEETGHKFARRPAVSSLQQFQQTSKSMTVNLMSRLSQGSVSDYLAIALIDGHVEVSFELGSGVCLLRSLQRINDDQLHSIQLIRLGKLAKLTLDQVNKYEANSPGKLSILNSDRDDFYIGGLPLATLSSLSSSTHNQPSLIYSTHFANFVGCISQLEINSLGPLDLVQSSHLTKVHFAQNLTPCQFGNHQQRSSSANKTSPQRPQKPYTSPPIESDDKEPDELRRRRRQLC